MIFASDGLTDILDISSLLAILFSTLVKLSALFEHEVGAISGTKYTRDDTCVKFAVEVCQLALITLDQPFLNFQSTLARRENGRYYFQGPSFEKASILRKLLRNLGELGSAYA
jgi:hypothetical protein